MNPIKFEKPADKPVFDVNQVVEIRAGICRAGRALLDWTTSKLARQASISLASVMDLERCRATDPIAFARVLDALAEIGVIVILKSECPIGVSFESKDRMSAYHGHSISQQSM